jgi:hypothetical protein
MIAISGHQKCQIVAGYVGSLMPLFCPPIVMNMHNEPKVFHESLGFFGSWGNVDSPKIEEF